VACTLLKAVVTTGVPLTEVAQVEQLFNAITPLLKDNEAAAAAAEEEETATRGTLSLKFKEEQFLVARIPHLLKSEGTDVLLRMLVICRTHFTGGGSSRMQFTFPPLVFAALHLARRVFARERGVESEGEAAPQYSTRKVFHFVIEIITAMATSHPEAALKLFLLAAQAADECGYHAIAYEFVKEALLLYECDVSDSRAQVSALTIVTGTLLNCKHFPTEDYEALITKVAQYANKLLKKADQCRMISLVSHLFWPKSLDGVERYSDVDRVLECMQRALKIASSCNPNLFVEILDRYVYYFENDNPVIQVRYLSGLIALINEQAGQAGGGGGIGEAQGHTPAAEAHSQNPLAYIKS
jgi:vacuolar protein sorting-associated protein 35